jgi:transposase-like protein
MNIIELFQSFQTQDQAVEHLEKVRWKGEPSCPYCGSLSIGRHASADRKQPRWQCRECDRAFAVTVGTMFHGTHVPLRDWFLVLALMLNAKKSASAYQIARDLGKRRATVWSMMQRIRTAMANDPAEEKLLYGIVEADETYVGGKPRKGNRRDDDKPSKRGRGTKKVSVIGVVERGGRVVAQVAEPGGLSAKGINKFIARFVDSAGSMLITDEYSGYNRVNETMLHAVVNHAREYANGAIHTNTIEGFWSLVKRAWYGSHHCSPSAPMRQIG